MREDATRHADEKHAAMPVKIAQSAKDQRRKRLGEDEGDDHPDDIARRNTERRRNRRKGYIDCGVERRHHRAETDQGEGESGSLHR